MPGWIRAFVINKAGIARLQGGRVLNWRRNDWKTDVNRYGRRCYLCATDGRQAASHAGAAEHDASASRSG